MVVIREGKRQSHRYNVARGVCDGIIPQPAGEAPGGPIMISSGRNRAVDDVMDAYVDWREECIRVWEAYQRWLSAARVDAALAFRAYVAALDGEQRASEVYGRLITALERRVATAPGTATAYRASD
jgi:hypothetical protein